MVIIKMYSRLAANILSISTLLKTHLKQLGPDVAEHPALFLRREGSGPPVRWAGRARRARARRTRRAGGRAPAGAAGRSRGFCARPSGGREGVPGSRKGAACPRAPTPRDRTPRKREGSRGGWGSSRRIQTRAGETRGGRARGWRCTSFRAAARRGAESRRRRPAPSGRKRRG